MPKLTIDGREVEVPEGTKVIEAAKEAGVEIPHFCYHPGLSIAGVCRLCMVEIEGQKKNSISCNTPVAEGMVVRTDTPELEEVRRSIYELHMINHPIDCPICDQSGECILQDYYMKIGRYKSAFQNRAEKVKKRKVVDLGGKILLDTERCILCDRCVRFCKEVTQNHELHRFHRGNHTEIGTFENRPLTGNYQENLVDICPVGALLSKDFRFKVRVWWLDSVDSVCNLCSRGCNIELHVRKRGVQHQNTFFHPTNMVYRIKPRVNKEVNGYWICDVGRYGYKQVYAEGRLVRPLRRDSTGVKEKMWDDAFEDITIRLRDVIDFHGASSVAAIGSARFTNEENYLLWRWMRQIIGISRLSYYRFIPRGGMPGFEGGDWGEFEDRLLIRKDKNPNTRGVQEIGFRHDITEDATELIEAIEKGEVKALYSLGNPLNVGNHPKRFLEAVERLDLFVVQEAFRNAWTERADWVLPGVSFMEKGGTFTNFEGRVQRIAKGIEPLGDAKADWEILAELIKRFDEKAVFTSAEEVFDALSRENSAFSGLTYRRIGSNGARLKDGPVD